MTYKVIIAIEDYRPIRDDECKPVCVNGEYVFNGNLTMNLKTSAYFYEDDIHRLVDSFYCDYRDVVDSIHLDVALCSNLNRELHATGKIYIVMLFKDEKDYQRFNLKNLGFLDPLKKEFTSTSVIFKKDTSIIQ